MAFKLKSLNLISESTAFRISQSQEKLYLKVLLIRTQPDEKHDE
jgi:hypothetical protein